MVFEVGPRLYCVDMVSSMNMNKGWSGCRGKCRLDGAAGRGRRRGMSQHRRRFRLLSWMSVDVGQRGARATEATAADTYDM